MRLLADDNRARNCSRVLEDMFLPDGTLRNPLTGEQSPEPCLLDLQPVNRLGELLQFLRWAAHLLYGVDERLRSRPVVAFLDTPHDDIRQGRASCQPVLPDAFIPPPRAQYFACRGSRFLTALTNVPQLYLKLLPDALLLLLLIWR